MERNATGRVEDTMRLELLVGVLRLAAEERAPEQLVAEAARLLAAAIGDVNVTYVEIEPGPRLFARYSTTHDGPREMVLSIPGYLERLEAGPVVVEDVARAEWLEPFQAGLEAAHVGSAVDVPLRRDGKLRGILWFNTPGPRRWSEHEVTVLTEVAEQLAMVLASSLARAHRLRAERDLRKRDAILEAIGRAAQQLLLQPSLDEAITELMRLLGEATGASSAHVFENVPGENGAPWALRRAGWTSGELPTIDDPRLGHLRPAPHFPRWAATLAAGEALSGHVRELPADERDALELIGARSVVAVPIFVDGRWWGFIGFEDFERERDWSTAETDALGAAAGLVAAAIDRDRSELALREHELKLRAVFETALDAIFITDDDRRYVDANPAACELIGVARQDLIGRHVDEFLPPDRREHVLATWDEYIGGGPVQEEWETMRPDGTVIVTAASSRPNFLPGLHIAFMRDITDRKRLEAELLSSQKLESLGRLAGGVAHDFNNLLTGITGYASLLLERTEENPDLQRDIGEIKRAADRAAALTKQLLAFGRRQVLKPRPLDLNASLSEVHGLLRSLLPEEIELDVRPGRRLGTVHADPGQVEQVLLNLVVNAGDAMPEGGRLTIETRNDDGFVELVVTDSGVGMDSETARQVFDPFFTTRDQGVGLGLASVHGIVEQSGGQIGVDSTPGVGSVFTVRLPRIRAAAETPGEAPAPEEAPGSETILLVEDENVVRDLARRVLERQGYSVLACADGDEAIAVALQHVAPIALLLTDVVMPGLRGYEVATQVAALRPGIKVLYMSGYAEEAFADRPAMADGTMIEKPFAVESLARRVREALET